jgi:hypothetical protein
MKKKMASPFLTDLEKAAHRLALSVGHRPACLFGPCTCGAALETADALADFWREYHKKEAQVVENVPTESS